DGVAIARRASGGGTVVIGPGTLNVAVVLPAAAAPGLGAVDVAQAYVLGRIARALRGRGPAVELLGSGDLTLDRRKFAGSARPRRAADVPEDLVRELVRDKFADPAWIERL